MNKKKILTCLLGMSLMMSNVVGAANFKDVPNNHWAKSYIDRGVNEGIIKGYDDNTFKPSKQITFSELSSLLSGLVSVSESEMQVINTTYGAKLQQLNVPEWVRPAVLRCLAKNVYSIQIVESVAKNGMFNDLKPKPVIRENVATFFANALGLSIPQTAQLSYKDANQISEKGRLYVKALLDINVLSAQGDGFGFFKPNDGIDRASIAKMLVTAINYKKNNTNNNSNTGINIPSFNQNVTGTIKSITPYSGQSYMIITKSDGKDEAFLFDATTQFNVDGVPAFSTSVQTGMQATLVVNSSTKKIISGTFKTQITEFTAVVSSLPDRYTNNYKLKVKKGNIESTEEYDFKDAKVYLNGKSASLSDIRVNTELKVKLLGNKVTEINIEKQAMNFDGYFVKFNYYRGEYEIEIDDGSRSNQRYVLDREVYVNDKRYRASDLARNTRDGLFIEGQPVQLKFDRSGKIVTDINKVFDSGITNGYLIGYINEQPRDRDDYIVIAPNSNSRRSDVVEFKLDNRFSISENGRYSRKNLRDIRRGQLVRLELKDGYVVDINLLRSSSSSRYDTEINEGKILDIITGNSFRIENLQYDINNRNYVEAYVNNQTVFIDGARERDAEMTYEDFKKWIKEDLDSSSYWNRRSVSVEFEYQISGGRVILLKVTII